MAIEDLERFEYAEGLFLYNDTDITTKSLAALMRWIVQGAEFTPRAGDILLTLAQKSAKTRATRVGGWSSKLTKIALKLREASPLETMAGIVSEEDTRHIAEALLLHLRPSWKVNVGAESYALTLSGYKWPEKPLLLQGVPWLQAREGKVDLAVRSQSSRQVQTIEVAVPKEYMAGNMPRLTYRKDYARPDKKASRRMQLESQLGTATTHLKWALASLQNATEKVHKARAKRERLVQQLEALGRKS